MSFEDSLRAIVREELQAFEKKLEHRLGPPSTPPGPPALLRVADVARALGVTAPTVLSWIASGRLRGRKPSRHWFVTQADLDRFLADDGSNHETINDGEHLRLLVDRAVKAGGKRR
jgi:excisionase family DNA binding protein